MNKTHPDLELICIKLPNEAIPAYLNENPRRWYCSSVTVPANTVKNSPRSHTNPFVWHNQKTQL